MNFQVSTTLGLNAFSLTAEPAYKQWVLEYVDAWIARAAANADAPGVLPSNVGLDGVIGSAAEGRWYGGCYGWGFAVDTNYMTGKTDGPGAFLVQKASFLVQKASFLVQKTSFLVQKASFLVTKCILFQCNMCTKIVPLFLTNRSTWRRPLHP